VPRSDAELVQRALGGCQVSGARLIRWLEEGDAAGVQALRELYPHSGRAYLLGITGPPGGGKSTLVDALIGELRRRGQRVGVIAVDPSSPFSGGALLGDRLRMQRHATDPGVFIRSMATRGHLGGLSRAAFESGIVLDAMGYDVVVLETVGVGQGELEVAGLAHTTAVVCVPGLGDEVQALKAGLMEVADVYVLNKADLPGADAAERHLRAMLHLRAPDPEGGWTPPLLRTVAARGEGVGELLDACLAHRERLERAGQLRAKRAQHSLHLLRELLGERAAERILAGAARRPALGGLLEDVRAQRIDPYTAAERLLAGFDLGPASD
jgi:LAO/AO transport system kinase